MFQPDTYFATSTVSIGFMSETISTKQLGTRFPLPQTFSDYFVRAGGPDAEAIFKARRQLDDVSDLLSHSERLRHQLQIKLEEVEERILADPSLGASCTPVLC